MRLRSFSKGQDVGVNRWGGVRGRVGMGEKSSRYCKCEMLDYLGKVARFNSLSSRRIRKHISSVIVCRYYQGVTFCLGSYNVSCSLTTVGIH